MAQGRKITIYWPPSCQINNILVSGSSEDLEDPQSIVNILKARLAPSAYHLKTILLLGQPCNVQ